MFPCFDGIQPTTSAFDGVAEMCLRSVCCLLSAWSRDNDSLNGGWVLAGTSPFPDTFTQQHAVWLPFVTQIQMWPANKGINVLCNLKPKADFLNCRSLCLFVLNMSGFLQKAPHALFETTKSMKKYDKRLFGTTAVACWQFTVGSGLRLIEVFGRHREGGGVWFCPPLISWKESWRKNKRWTVRNNVVLSRAQLIVLILLLPACHVAPSCMNGVDCVKITEISFHILIMYLEYSSVYVNKFTLLKAVTESFVSKKHVLYPKYLVISSRFCRLSVIYLHFLNLL